MLEPDPLEPGHRTKEVYAFMAVDPADDSEGIVGYKIGNSIVPLVASDDKRLDSYRPLAQQVATATNQEIRVAKFSIREDLEVIKP